MTSKIVHLIKELDTSPNPSNNKSKNKNESSSKTYLPKSTSSMAIQKKFGGIALKILKNDPNPIIIRKKPIEKLEYTQNIAIKYLKPPSLPPPGDIIIRQEPDRIATPLPPIVIRQRMKTPPTPEPIIIRERPPPVPPLIPKKIITIQGKVIPAKRSVIIEKVESKPPKPPMIIIERWLPYDNLNHKRNVIYQKAEKNLDRKKNQDKVNKKNMDSNLSSTFENHARATSLNDQRNLNIDPSPIIVHKKPAEPLTHVQNVSLKFLKPPKPDQPGDITIVQDPDTRAPSPPPLVLRKDAPAESVTPPPVIIREQPPMAPASTEDKIITIPGKIIQKPRKIIIEHVFREVRYENIPPQFTREQIKKYIKDKLRRQKAPAESIEFESKESGSASMLTNVSALSIENSKASAPVVSHASASFISQQPQPSSHASVQFASNNSVLTNISNRPNASAQFASNRPNGSVQFASNNSVLANISNRPNASVQYSSNNSVLAHPSNKSHASMQFNTNNPPFSNLSNVIERNNSFTNNSLYTNHSNANLSHDVVSNVSVPAQQQSHTNASMPIQESRPEHVPYYPGYQPPQSHLHLFTSEPFSRQNIFYATGPIRPYRFLSRGPPIIQYENNYSSLSADFFPNRAVNMNEIDINNSINGNRSNFRRSASLMRPQHEDANSGLRLLGFNL